VRRVQTLGNSETNVWRVAIISALDIITCRWWRIAPLSFQSPWWWKCWTHRYWFWLSWRLLRFGFTMQIYWLCSPCDHKASGRHDEVAFISSQDTVATRTRSQTLAANATDSKNKHRLRSQCPRPAAQSCTLQDPCPPRSRHGNRRLPDSLPKSVQCEGRGEGNCGCL